MDLIRPGHALTLTPIGIPSGAPPGVQVRCFRLPDLQLPSVHGVAGVGGVGMGGDQAEVLFHSCVEHGGGDAFLGVPSHGVAAGDGDFFFEGGGL